jgi:hypothetical protein
MGRRSLRIGMLSETDRARLICELGALRRTLNAHAAQLQISSLDYQAIGRLPRAANAAADELSGKTGALWHDGYSTPDE